MKEFTKVNSEFTVVEDLGLVTLSFVMRQKSRLHVALDNGESVGIFLSRGTVLKDGDVLSNDSGMMAVVRSADELVSTVKAPDVKLLSRIAYHLGNRHVALQVERDWLRYLNDYVLDEMVLQLGGEVEIGNLPFHPESGAYGGGHHLGHEK